MCSISFLNSLRLFSGTPEVHSHLCKRSEKGKTWERCFWENLVNNYYLPWHHNFTMLIWCLSKNKNPGGLWKCFCSVGALGVHKVSFYLSWLAHLLDLQLATLFVLISLLQWWANSYSLVFIHFLARIFEPQPKVDIYITASYTHTHTSTKSSTLNEVIHKNFTSELSDCH